MSWMKSIPSEATPPNPSGFVLSKPFTITFSNAIYNYAQWANYT